MLLVKDKKAHTRQALVDYLHINHYMRSQVAGGMCSFGLYSYLRMLYR